MKKSFCENRTALITGASGGIGAEIARLFAADGANLVLVARSKDRLSAFKSELEEKHSVQVTVISADLAQAGAAQALYNAVKESHIAVDVLVNNAGFGDFGLFAHSKLEKQREMIQLNIATLMELTRLFLPDMLSNKFGRILNVASVAGFMPGPAMSVYYASKAFVRSFTEALSVELEKTGVKVTAFCPGPVKTDFWNRAEAKKSSLFKKMIFADSRKVALCGYRAMKRGKVLAVPGIMTKFFVFVASVLPRSWVRHLVYWIQK